MGEPRRLDVSHSAEGDAGVARESQAETLLVDGLDRYFAGQYDDAIHIWTRVLFLDRTHARARAYIDRARSAQAERQRQSEELLQRSHALLDRGQADAARHLLAEAVATIGDDERAAALRVRLERVERASAATPASSRLPIVAAPDALPGWAWTRRSPAIFAGIIVGAAALVLLLLFTSSALQNWTAGSPSESLAGAAVPAPLPVLTSSDAALVRARTLYSRGRLAEALQALQRVDESSPVRQDAETLRVVIQRLLLASGQDHSRALQDNQGIGR